MTLIRNRGIGEPGNRGIGKQKGYRRATRKFLPLIDTDQESGGSGNRENRNIGKQKGYRGTTRKFLPLIDTDNTDQESGGSEPGNRDIGTSENRKATAEQRG